MGFLGSILTETIDRNPQKHSRDLGSVSVFKSGSVFKSVNRDLPGEDLGWYLKSQPEPIRMVFSNFCFFVRKSCVASASAIVSSFSMRGPFKVIKSDAIRVEKSRRIQPQITL